MAHCVSALKEWTGKGSATIIFDSTVDEFTHDGLFMKVKAKSNIALVGFTTEGDVFGGFYSVAVDEQEQGFWDPNIFAFSFESHGRCQTPQRFPVKDGMKDKAYLFFSKNHKHGIVRFGVSVGGFTLGNENSDSYCYFTSDGFVGLENVTLSGQNYCNPPLGPYHHCTRLVAIQLS